jgi:hypothetical protein
MTIIIYLTKIFIPDLIILDQNLNKVITHLYRVSNELIKINKSLDLSLKTYREHLLPVHVNYNFQID